MRVEARAAEIGKSVADVLRDAGVSSTFFLKPPTNGRRIDKIEKIARALDWSLCEILGCAGQASISQPVLRRALTLTDRALRRDPDRAPLFVATVALVYDVIAAREREDKPVDESLIEEMIRRRTGL